MLWYVELEFVGCSLVIVGETLLLGLVAISNVVWPITWTVSEAWRKWLVNIVGSLLVVIVVGLEFVGC